MNRYGEQVETVTTQTLLDSWLGGMRQRRGLMSARISHLVEILLQKENGKGQPIDKDLFDGSLKS